MTAIKMPILATILVLTSLSADALDIRDIHLGDAWDTKTLQAKLRLKGDPVGNIYFPRVTCGGHSCSGFISINGRGYPVEISVQERDKKVSQVNVTLDGRDYVDGFFEEDLQALTIKFGKPGYDRSAVVQNAFGAKYTDREVAWEVADETLVVRKYSPTLEKGYIKLWAKRYQVVNAPKNNL
jgi:hypothetical protein